MRIKYCHGDVKDAYFAHLNNANCDYAKFDSKIPSEIRTIRTKLFNAFKEKGYNVSLEEKIIPHHYTHLVFNMPDGNRIALESGSQQTTAEKIESLNNLYLNEGISVKWIVIGNTDFQIAENYNRRGAGLRLLCGRGGGYGAVFIHNSFVCKV